MQTMTLERARREANIHDKAATLFTLGGYRYKPFHNSDALFYVYPPQVEKPAYIVDVVNAFCSCRGHREAGVCSHRLAMEQEAAWLASADARAAEHEEQQAARFELLAGKF